MKKVLFCFKKNIYWIFIFVIFLIVLLDSRYFELEIRHDSFDSSLIGLTIDGVASTTFPTKESGKAIDSISCDKGASGVWDYTNWLLKVRNVTESRTKCQVNFVSKYHEPLLNGTDPVLKDGLIPVMIESDGTVKKASLGWEWYKYGDANSPRWANAVILNDETEIYYDGDIIPEEAIESYFVWIPRYRYQIFNVGNYTGSVSSVVNAAKIINIEFENKDTPKSTGSTVGSWLTHPAFTSFETNGMWVGKFEAGYKDANTTAEAEKNENNPGAVQIKPNVYSWRNINISNAYLTSYNYQREYNSHMIKNTEWGAVAYLQHSQFGSHKNIRINNNSDYKTGYAAVHEATIGFTDTNISCSTNKDACNEYGTDESITKSWNTDIGILASTTGNITGLYDMSGGSWELTMSVMLYQNSGVPCSGRNATYNSGFNGPYCDTPGSKSDGEPFPTDQRYYDTYTFGTAYTDYSHRILGDATGEVGPFAARKYGTQTRQVSSWYADESWFITSGSPWFTRGSVHYLGTDAGIFSFLHTLGSPYSTVSYRIVLSM